MYCTERKIVPRTERKGNSTVRKDSTSYVKKGHCTEKYSASYGRKEKLNGACIRIRDACRKNTDNPTVEWYKRTKETALQITVFDTGQGHAWLAA
jgi:hypothetical protein